MIFNFLIIDEKNNNYGVACASNKIGVRIEVPNFVKDNKKVRFESIISKKHEIWNTGIYHVADEDPCDYGINWESIPVEFLDEPKNFQDLCDYVNLVGCRIKHFEHLLFQKGEAEFIDGSLVISPNCEQSVLSNVLRYLNYSHSSKRAKRFENAISKSDPHAEDYFQIIKNFDSWKIEEIKRSPCWMYNYCDIHGYDEEIYNAMMFWGLTQPNNLYVKRFAQNKRFVPKNLRKNILSKKDFILRIIKDLEINPRSWRSSRTIHAECKSRGMDIGLAYITKVKNEYYNTK